MTPDDTATASDAEDTQNSQPPNRVRHILKDPRVLVGMSLLALFIVASAIGPIVVAHGPDTMSAGSPLTGPSLEHPFGTDRFGRDQLSRVLAGGRISLGVATIVMLGSISLGLPLGLLAGYRGGFVDSFIGRALDVFLAFPSLLLALVLTVILGPGLTTATIALVLIYTPTVVRLVRGATAAEAVRDYVTAARSNGASSLRVIMSHISPNIASQILVIATLIMALSILGEAGLSFLGFGAQPPTASWGRMLTENRQFLTSEPYLVIFPGAAIALLVLAFNLIGDGLRDHLDPTQRRVARG